MFWQLLQLLRASLSRSNNSYVSITSRKSGMALAR